jgi:hypothetical protein
MVSFATGGFSFSAAHAISTGAASAANKLQQARRLLMADLVEGRT